MSFVHLHLHTEYSLLDGECRIDEIPAMVASAGQNAVAITDHSVLYGAVPFFKACQAQGIKPIIGCEINVAPRKMADRDQLIDSHFSCLTLLVQDQIGYRNLTEIVSKSYTEGFFQVPRTDLDTLKKHHEGLIALSGCSLGYIPQCILSGNRAEAKKYAQKLFDIFGEDHFYLEIERHGNMEERTVSDVLAQMSSELNIPLVATNDVHYLRQEDYDVQNMLSAISAGETLSEHSGKKGSQYYLKTEAEMCKIFPDLPQSVQNSQRIADSCHFSFDFQSRHLPVFPVLSGGDSKELLRRICNEGYEAKRKSNPDFGGPIYEERIQYELSVIEEMGFSDYYLIVWDFISYARKKGIPVGPGRGSGVGSLVAYCIGITDADPVQFNLIFERFLNPERVTMPDFDVDFGDTRRGEVIDYVSARYGSSCVAQIVTFGTMQYKQALRDACKALEVPATLLDRILRLIPKDDGMTIEKALQSSKELREFAQQEPLVEKALYFSSKLEGRPRNASTHASGVVITDKPIVNYSPITINDGTTLTQFPMNSLSDLGLLKFDFLANTYLTTIHDVEKEIQKTNPDFSIKNIPLNDKKVFHLLSSGDTLGLFQLDSMGMRSLLKRVQPKCFEDIVSVISLYRPGPALSIDTFLQNRAHPDQITYAVPQLKPILEPTFGCIIYQEEVMQICRDLAGYTFGQADIVRRAMAKKKPEAMEKERNAFVNGCVRNGISSEIAEQLFHQISGFAKYAFNKSHSVAYSMVTYQTAYLKTYYPAQFMASLLNSIAGDFDRISYYADDCALMGIKILPPDANESMSLFVVEGNQIRYGLSAIKNIGLLLATHLVSERQVSKFQTIEDFLSRCGSFLTTRALEALIKSGALDCFGNARSILLQNASQVLESIAKQVHSQSQGQIGMFDDSPESSSFNIDFSGEETLSPIEKVQYEKEFTGLFLSGHPLDIYKDYANSVHAISSTDIRDAVTNQTIGAKQEIHFVGSLVQKRTHVTKSNATMAFLRAEDAKGGIDLVLFPDSFSKFGSLLKVGDPYDFLCTVSDRPQSGANSMSLIVKSISEPRQQKSDSSPITSTPLFLYLRINQENQNSLSSALSLLQNHPGASQTRVYFEQEKRVRIATKYACDITPELLSLLKKILGEDNVAAQPQDSKKGNQQS